MEEEILIYYVLSILGNSCGVLLSQRRFFFLVTSNSATTMAHSPESSTESSFVKLVCSAVNDPPFNSLEKLYLDEETADVYFITSKRIPAHKTILLAASDVFRAHFAGDWKDKNQVVIQDADVTAFQTLLGYIYKGQIEMDMNNLFNVLCIAHRFNVQGVIDKLFSQSVFEKYCPQSIWQYLSFAIVVNDEVRKKMCLAFVDSNATECFALDDFLGIGLDAMKSFISRDTLIVTEVVLFKACLNWSVAECERQKLDVTPENQRQVMEPFIHEIRFPVMSIQELEEVIEPSKILKPQEVLLITKVMVSKDRTANCGFKFDPRRVTLPSVPKGNTKPNQEHIALWNQLKNLVCVAAIGYDESKTRIACKSCKISASPFGMELDYDMEGAPCVPETYNCATGICLACEIHCHSQCEMGQRVISGTSAEATYGPYNMQAAVCSCPLDKCMFLKRAKKY